MALIDSGASGNLMSPLAASLFRVAVKKGPHDTAVTLADGSRHACGNVALDVPLRMGHQSHTMQGSESFFVPETSHHAVADTPVRAGENPARDTAPLTTAAPPGAPPPLQRHRGSPRKTLPTTYLARGGEGYQVTTQC